MWLNKSAIVATVVGFACFVSRFMFAYCAWASWETICRSRHVLVHQSVAHFVIIKSLSLSLILHNLKDKYNLIKSAECNVDT